MVGYSQRQNSDLRPDSLDRFRYPLHFLLLAKGFGERMEIRQGYREVLTQAMSKPEPVAHPA